MINETVNLTIVADEQFSDTVLDLAFVPASENDTPPIYFVARLTGLYRSDNGGASWQFLYDSLQLDEALPTPAVLASRDPEGDIIVLAGIAGGILRSGDAGQTWEKVFLPTPPATITALTLSPDCANDGMVFAGTLDDGLYYSCDYGMTWQHGNFGLLDYHVLCIAVSPNFSQDSTVFIGTQSGIFRSNNGGRSWREVDLPPGYMTILSLAISPEFGQDGVLLAGTEAQGLWKTQDHGNSWALINTKFLNAPVDKVLMPSDNLHCPNLLVLSQGQVLGSTDKGATWTPWPHNTPAKQYITVITVPSRFDIEIRVLLGCSTGEIVIMR